MTILFGAALWRLFQPCALTSLIPADIHRRAREGRYDGGQLRSAVDGVIHAPCSHPGSARRGVETVLQRALERYPEARPRIISDNGPAFISREFKKFIRSTGMTHVRTSPYYPQSNGKSERLNQTAKVTTIRPRQPDSPEMARQVMTEFREYYNHQRLHSAIGFITPADMLAGHAATIWAARDQKLEAARARRRALWQDSPTKTASQDGPGSTTITTDKPRAGLQS
ncbi:MAG: transposase, partial [Gemmatimonadaceae bacterium]